LSDFFFERPLRCIEVARRVYDRSRRGETAFGKQRSDADERLYSCRISAKAVISIRRCKVGLFDITTTSSL